jgi:hypothetical protein
MKNPSPAELNRINREFWAAEIIARERLMADPEIFGRAIEAISFEAAREVPVRSQLTLEQALRNEEAARGVYVAQQRRRAGSARKTDALQAFIIQTVQADRSIKCAQLLAKLRRKDFICEINTTEIVFFDKDGREKRAPRSGLKDRLSRAKKSLK